MDINENDSEELRLRIHRLLGEYSRAHYTTDYIEFTENFVAEVQGGFYLLSSLIDFFFLS